MEEIIFLSSKDYSESDHNYGDCIIIDTGNKSIIYDCGSEEHAKRAIQYLDNHGYDTATFILSHNDADHFDGLNYLIEQNRIECVYTMLLLKYVDEIYELLDDKRHTRESLKRQIEEILDNIYSLSGKVKLKDVFEDTDVCNEVTIVGPDKDYALEAIAKRIDNSEGDTIDKETIVNAVSTQVSVAVNGGHLLLTGDSSVEAIKDKLPDYNQIQLPHHGKAESAEEIFGIMDGSKMGTTGVTYFVSDNTGSSNGGSDKLKEKGHHVYNTKKLGDVRVVKDKARNFGKPYGCYGVKE